MNFLNSQQEKGMSSMIKITQNILKETKMIQELNLKPNHQIKLL